MTTAYQVPTPTPATMPPNREAPQKPAKTLAIWLVLMVCFVATYMGVREHLRPTHDRAPADDVSKPRDSKPIPSWPLLIPFATAGAFGLLFWRRRERLPAAYKTMVLREKPAIQPETVVPVAAPEPPSMTPIEISGSSGDRNVTMRMSDAGIWWNVKKTLLLGENQELEVGWEEVEQVTVIALKNQFVVWGVMIAIFGATYALCSRGTSITGGLVAVGVGTIVAVSSIFLSTAGQFTLATPTHALVIHGRALNADVREKILAAVKARRPTAVPDAAPGGCLTSLNAALIRPFREIRHLWRTPESILADFPTATYANDAERIAAVEQRRLYGVWISGLLGFLPLSIGLAGQLMFPMSLVGPVAWAVAWFCGAIAAKRMATLMVRLTGMTLIR